MASERDLELLDEYLRNRLSEKDKTAFEKAMESDPALKKEFVVQKRIVEGIRKSRTVELKKMLNDIPLTSIPQQGPTLLAQLGAAVLVAGLVGTGIYIYVKDEGKEPASALILRDSTPATEQTIPSAPDATADSPSSEEPIPVLPQGDINGKVKIETDETAQPVPEKPKVEDVNPATRDVFDPSEDVKEAEEIVDESKKTNRSLAPSIAVTTEPNSKYSWHYQFRDDKLYLYGVFEKNLYEIMEFFSDDKRTMFLYYKDNFYLLNEEDNKVKPLNAIGDKALLKKLRDYRAGQ